MYTKTNKIKELKEGGMVAAFQGYSPFMNVNLVQNILQIE